MSESVTINDQTFIKDPKKGWIDKKTKQPANKGLLRLLDSLDLQPVQKRLKVDIDNSIEPITLSATEKYVFDRNSGWVDAKTKQPAAPDMLKLLDSLKSKVNAADDTTAPTAPKPTPKVKPKPKKPAKPAEPTEAAPTPEEPEEPVKGSKFKALAKGFAGGFLGSYGVDLQKIVDERKEKKEAEAERLQEIKDTYYTVEESEDGVKKYRDVKTGRYISPTTAADYDILAEEEFKKEKRKKLIKDVGKGFAGGFLGSYNIDLQKIIDERKEAAAVKASGKEASEVDDTKKGPAEKGPKALDKPSISVLSNSFTNLITAFNGMDTYSKNTNAIFKAQQDAKADVAKETTLENDITPAPIATGGTGDSSSEYLASALPGVTEQLGTLTELISSGALQGSGSGSLGLIGGQGGGFSFGKKAAIVGGIAAASAVGYYAATRSSTPAPSARGEGAAVKQQAAKATTQAESVKEKTAKAEKQRQDILSGKSSMLGGFGSKIAGWMGNTFHNVTEYVSHIPERLAALFQQGSEYLASGMGVGTSGYAEANLAGARGEWTQDAPFITGVNALAQKWNIDAGDLLGMMHAESGIQANIQNSIGATGLIQFMPSTARAMGTSVDAIKRLSRAQQLPLVDQYFTMNRLPTGATAGQLYASVFWPAALRRPSDHVIAARGSRVYSQNAGLDMNRDGSITVGDLTQRVSQKRQEIGLGPSNTTGGFRAFTNIASNVGSNVAQTVQQGYQGIVGGVTDAARYVASGLTQTASNFLGATEGRGADRLNAFIGQFFPQFMRGNPRGIAAVPWCSAFTNAVLGSQGLPGTGSALASSFLNYGAIVYDRPSNTGNMSNAQPGDVVVVNWSNPGVGRPGQSGNHVGFIAQVPAGGRFRMIGGNQSDRSKQSGGAVTEVGGRSNVIVSIRRPTGRARTPGAAARPQAPTRAPVVATTADRAIDAAARTAHRAVAATTSAYNAASEAASSAYNYLTGGGGRSQQPPARPRTREYQQALGNARGT